MKLRVADRILVAVAGLLLIALCAGVVVQMFFGVDLIGIATRVFNSPSTTVRVALIALCVVLLLLGVYCLLVLFRHKKRRDRFVTQKNDAGELAISMKALESMVNKCLETHPEIESQGLELENEKDGLLVRIRGIVAGGISIPLTMEALQRQIKQYVTACSGVEVKGIRVEIESSGPDAEDAPFAIEAPQAPARLKEAEKTGTGLEEVNRAALSVSAETGEMTPVNGDAPAVEPAPQTIPVPAEDEEDDDRPLHQRLFKMKNEPCIIPEPPVEEEQAADPSSAAGTGAEEAGREAAESESEEAAMTAEKGTEDTEGCAESGFEVRGNEGKPAETTDEPQEPTTAEDAQQIETGEDAPLSQENSREAEKETDSPAPAEKESPDYSGREGKKKRKASRRAFSKIQNAFDSVINKNHGGEEKENETV